MADTAINKDTDVETFEPIPPSNESLSEIILGGEQRYSCSRESLQDLIISLKPPIIFGWDRKLGREVAFKFIPDKKVKASGDLTILPNDNLPHTLKVYSQISDARIEGGILLVLEKTLGSLEDKEYDNIDQVLSVLKQLAQALDTMHSEGNVHADIKLDNILLVDDKTVKISDFGISKKLTELQEYQKNPENMRSGTLLYMPPEALITQSQFSSDQFSLALSILELLYPKVDRYRKFRNDLNLGYDEFSVMANLGGLHYKLADDTNASALPDIPIQLAIFNNKEDLPQPIRTVFKKALSVDPALRYASCTEFYTALNAAVEEWRNNLSRSDI